jgi:hypothetical protein
MDKKKSSYDNFEQGSIRPPSEAKSLLLRVTRNCPWNRCTFCPLYKGARFSIRPLDHVKKDIDTISNHVSALKKVFSQSEKGERIYWNQIDDILKYIKPAEMRAFYAALNWFNSGMKSVFLQDANTLVVKTSDLAEILLHLKSQFPMVERITSYGRSHTIARMNADALESLRDAGLNRIHIGLESGSDKVLKMVQKGATKAIHIKAGLKVKMAGIELSEYYIPGLGGKKLSAENATETADAMNQINPDFIRIRTLAIPKQTPLFADYKAGRFEKCTDIMMAEEILLFINHLSGITSVVQSDHILNLFGELRGKLPKEKEFMTKIILDFLDMAPENQFLYQAGRRLGIFFALNDMKNPRRLRRVQKACREFGLNPQNVDAFIEEQIDKFI